jgi:hypothetical protein
MVEHSPLTMISMLPVDAYADNVMAMGRLLYDV